MAQRLRASTHVLVLVGVALAIAWLENWMLWGYVVWRPSLVGTLDDADQLVAFSMIGFEPRPMVVQPPERVISMDIHESYCRPRSNECRDGILLLRLEERFGNLAVVPEVDLRLIEDAWAVLPASGWLPVVPDPPYQKTGIPLSGFAISVRRASEEYLLLTFGTGQISNDRYAYSEVLYRLDGGKPRMTRQIHYFIEIAGMEGLEWPVLWPLNLAVLLIGYHVLWRGLGRFLAYAFLGTAWTWYWLYVIEWAHEDTITAPGFSWGGWKHVDVDMSQAEVEAFLGPPLPGNFKPLFAQDQGAECWISNRSTGYFAALWFEKGKVVRKMFR